LYSWENDNVASPADDIPDLERLMRNVVRLALERERGTDWIASLSKAQQSGIEKASQVARRKRPGEPLRDGWDAAGLSDIAGILRSAWPSAMSHVWPDSSSAAVDLDRLVAYRDKNLHAIGPPSGQIGDQEVSAMVQRLRVGFESARRDLLDDTGEWWPYIAAVHSNIPEFRFERSSSGPLVRAATLTEGDLVTFDAIGIHPLADPSRLRYRLLSPNVPELRTPTWVADGSFSFSVPHSPSVQLNLYVADGQPMDLLGTEWVHFRIKVRPLQP
jgi:hypothetical protein